MGLALLLNVVEVKDVEIPQNMQRAMARQAESERERRAKIIAAEGEYQASERLRQAADRLESPTALQLRLFQTMGEIAVNQNSTIILPVPIDLIRPFMEPTNGPDGASRATRHKGKEAEKLNDEVVGDISSETPPDGDQTPDEPQQERTHLPYPSAQQNLPTAIHTSPGLTQNVYGRKPQADKRGPKD